jgi:hypothetical protein
VAATAKPRLRDLPDVDVPTVPGAGQALVWDTSVSPARWRPSDIGTQAEVDAAVAGLQAEIDTKGRVVTGTATPALGDLQDGDTYFQLDGSGNVVAEYVRAP